MSKQIICPIYNEGENVKILYDSLCESKADFDELAFIHDLETDTSLPFIEKISAEDPRVKAVLNTTQRGVVHALKFAFSRAQPGPVIVVMGDNSDKLSVIPEMQSLWSAGARIVSPSRYMPGGKMHGGPPLKSFLSKLQGRVLGCFGFPTCDPTNNFKLYDGAWLSSQNIESTGGFEIALELCYRAFLQKEEIVELPTEWWDRTQGESNFKMWAWMPLYLKWYFPTLALTLRRRMRLA